MTVTDLSCPRCRRPVKLSERASRSSGKLVYSCSECEHTYSLRGREGLEEEGGSLEDSGTRTVRIRRPGRPRSRRLQDFRAPSATGSMPRGVRLTLECVDGPDRGLTVPIRHTRNVVGRGRGDVSLSDPLISRRHAILEIYDSETIILKDLASTNGTYHNGRLIDHCRLEDGDEIRVGHSLLNVIIERAA